MPWLVLAVSDLMFAARIADAARAAGWALATPAADDEASAQLSRPGAALVTDLQDRAFDALALLEAARAAGVPALAFGRHTDAASLQRARRLGATAVPRSDLVARLSELLAGLAPSAGPATRP
jgi:hypothetical protein